jgi:hypothetical protein
VSTIADATRTSTSKQEDLEKAISHLLEECRMVLPGIQALFGFQWVAVFNQRFTELTLFDQRLHFLATGVVAVAAALVMTPAAYHRSLGGKTVNERLLRTSTRLVLASMFFLVVGLSFDFFVVSTLIFASRWLCYIAAAFLGAILFALWFVFPRTQQS